MYLKGNSNLRGSAPRTNYKKALTHRVVFTTLGYLNVYKDGFFFFKDPIGALYQGCLTQDIRPNSFRGHRQRLKLWLGRGFDHSRGPQVPEKPEVNQKTVRTAR